MNEVILIIIVLIVIMGSKFLMSRQKKPSLNYTRIIAAIALLVLIWFFGEGAPIGSRMILTVIALTSMGREYSSLKKLGVDK